MIIAWSLREIDFPEFGHLVRFAEHWLLVLEVYDDPLDSIVIHYGRSTIEQGNDNYRIETLRDALEWSGRDWSEIHKPIGYNHLVHYINPDNIVGFDGYLTSKVTHALDNFCMEKYESMFHNCQDFIVILARLSGNLKLRTQMDSIIY